MQQCPPVEMQGLWLFCIRVSTVVSSSLQNLSNWYPPADVNNCFYNNNSDEKDENDVCYDENGNTYTFGINFSDRRSAFRRRNCNSQRGVSVNPIPAGGAAAAAAVDATHEYCNAEGGG